MKKYLLLRKNSQTGPHSLEELSAMGLTAQDLLWIEGKSASWKHPGEVEELKCLVPGAVEKKFDRVPMQRTRLKNDNILFRTQNNITQNRDALLTENEVLEFPTLARFFMTEHYENYRQSVKSETRKSIAEKVENGIKKPGVWVSLPSANTTEKIILISGRDKKLSVNTSGMAISGLAKPVADIDFAKGCDDSNVIQAEEIVAVKEAEYAKLEIVSDSQLQKEEEILLSSYNCFDQLIAEVSSDPVIKNEERKVAPVIRLSQRISPLSYSKILQKLAVAVAIGSLITVAYLITDSILNPAYSLQPLTVKTKVVNSPLKIEPPVEAVVIPAASVSDQDKKDQQLGDPGLEPDNQKVIRKKQKEKVTVEELSLQGEMNTEKEATSSESTEPVSAVPLPVQVIEPRKALAELVDIKMEGLKVGLLGGIKEFDLVVKNNSDIPIDQLVVELRYIQSNKKVFKTEMLEFSDIAAQSHQMQEVPKSARGIKVESSIKSIAAKDVPVALNN